MAGINDQTTPDPLEAERRKLSGDIEENRWLSMDGITPETLPMPTREAVGESVRTPLRVGGSVGGIALGSYAATQAKLPPREVVAAGSIGGGLGSSFGDLLADIIAGKPISMEKFENNAITESAMNAAGGYFGKYVGEPLGWGAKQVWGSRPVANNVGKLKEKAATIYREALGGANALRDPATLTDIGESLNAGNTLADELGMKKLSIGELLYNKPNVLKAERNIAQGQQGATSYADRVRENMELADDYIQRQLPRPTGMTPTEAAVKPVTEAKALLDNALATAKLDVATMELTDAGMTPTKARILAEKGEDIPGEVGRGLRLALDQEKKAWKGELGPKFNKLEEVAGPASTASSAEAYVTLMDKLEQYPGLSDVMPKSELEVMRKHLFQYLDDKALTAKAEMLEVDPKTLSRWELKPEIDFKDARDITTRLNRTYGNLHKAMTQDRPGAREAMANIQELRGAILSDAKTSFENPTEYERLLEQYKGFIKTYREGTVGKVLLPGHESGGFHYQDAAVAKELFKSPQAAEDLIRALGGTDARKLVETFATADMAAKKVILADGSLDPTAFNNWFMNNNKTLNAYGLLDRYETLGKAQEAVNSAQAMVKEFNKTAVSRVLGANVDNVFEALFEGTTKANRPAAMQELYDMIKSDPNALQGAQAAWLDFIQRQTGRLKGKPGLKVNPTTKEYEATYDIDRDKLLNVMHEYNDSTFRLFQNNPDLLAKWDTYQRGMLMATAAVKPSGAMQGMDVLARNNPLKLADKHAKLFGELATALGGTPWALATFLEMRVSPVVAGTASWVGSRVARGLTRDAWRTADAALSKMMVEGMENPKLAAEIVDLMLKPPAEAGWSNLRSKYLYPLITGEVGWKVQDSKAKVGAPPSAGTPTGNMFLDTPPPAKEGGVTLGKPAPAPPKQAAPGQPTGNMFLDAPPQAGVPAPAVTPRSELTSTPPPAQTGIPESFQPRGAPVTTGSPSGLIKYDSNGKRIK